MKGIWLIITLILINSQGLLAQNEALTVNVLNVKEQKGFMMIAVYDSADKFLTEELVVGARVEVGDEVISFRFEELPFGEYAISVYHDVDSDGELATNFMGMPKEPYGFSNGGVNLLGIPSFNRAVFAFVDPGQEINIELK